jgi:hypothetical protein
MAGFTKIFSSILDSTIWCEPWPIKGVWITMLTMADQYGNVHASIPGLAKRATVSIQECEEALKKFQAPDPYSRTTDFEGRRIEAMDGGWHLLNYTRYREMRDEDVRREQNRLAQRKHRMSAKNADSQQNSVTNPSMSATVSHGQPLSAQAEAEAEAESTTTTPLPPSGGKRVRRTRDEITEPYPEKVRLVVNAALRDGFWPKTDPKDQRVITVDVPRLCSNVNRIMTEHPTIAPEELVQAMESYVAKHRERYAAPQFFFGSNGRDGSDPHWLAEYRMVKHQEERRKAAQQAQECARKVEGAGMVVPGFRQGLNDENHSQHGGME